MKEKKLARAAANLHSDPTFRVSRIKSLLNDVVSVAPDSSVREAVTLMMEHDYSQLPVIGGGRTPKGVFSWRSLGSRQFLGAPCRFVREAMEDAQFVPYDSSILEAIAAISRHDYVLVLDSHRRLKGILTAADFGSTFAEIAEPFLLLNEIEEHVRLLLKGRVTTAEMAQARNPLAPPGKVKDIADLSLGAYVRLLQNPAIWKKVGLRLHRATFAKSLDEVRRIRNDVMHFDPQGIGQVRLRKLRNFARLLRKSRRLRRRGSPAKK